MTPAELARIAPWAAKLKEGECKHVAPSVRLRELRRGEHLMHLDDLVDAWHGAVSGVLRVGMVSDDGQIAGFSAVIGGAWFGEGSILKNERRRYDVVAVTDATVAVLPGEMFRWLYSNSPGFNQYLVLLLNERLGQFIAAREIDRLNHPDDRVARSLAALFHPVLYPGVGEMLRITQQELGYLVGLSRQRVNEALHALQAAGVIRVEYGGVRVLDLDRLRSYSAEG